jgi:acyl-CoA synthetase (AMP-forming)/AMP-acid ligase II
VLHVWHDRQPEGRCLLAALDLPSHDGRLDLAASTPLRLLGHNAAIESCAPFLSVRCVRLTIKGGAHTCDTPCADDAQQTIPQVDFFAMSGADCVLSIVPMFHVMSWGLPFGTLMLGCKTCLNNRFMAADDILRMFTDEGVTFSAGVPTIWQGIRTALEEDPALAEGLTLNRLACGGSAPAAEMMEW